MLTISENGEVIDLQVEAEEGVAKNAYKKIAKDLTESIISSILLKLNVEVITFGGLSRSNEKTSYRKLS